MAQVAETDRIVISDFRPGIYADYHASGAAIPADTTGPSTIANGAATLANTYRCIADTAGALVPLPKLVAGPAAAKIAANHVTSRDAAYILDGIVLTDLYTEGEVPAATVNRPAVFLMTGEWVESDAYRWTVIARMYRLFDTPNTGTQDIMYAKGDTSILVSETTKAHIGAGQFCNFRAQYSADSFFTYQSVCMVAFGAPDYLATEPAWVSGTIASPDTGWTDFDATNNGVYPSANSGRILGIFPDYDNIGTAQTKFLSTAGMTAASYITTHQGRLVAGAREHGDFGENPSGETIGMLNEHVHYTPPFDFDATNEDDAELTFGTFGERRPWLSGVIASISADELLLIKHRDGGLLVRGDLDDPTIVDLPFMHSTLGARSVPAWTPKGLVYGGRNGVYMWMGGETTEYISPQLEGWFWNPDPNNIERYGTHGRFAWWDPFVVAPNNYIYDSRSGAWWRLDDVVQTDGADAIQSADISPVGDRLYAFPFAFTSNQLVAWRTADKSVLADTYSWQSQPLPLTADRLVTIRELRLLATHKGTSAGTITVTISGYTDEGEAVTPVSTAITLDANRDRPQLKVVKLAVKPIAHVQVRIEANSGNTAQAAPKVHSLSLSIGDRQHIPSR